MPRVSHTPHNTISIIPDVRGDNEVVAARYIFEYAISAGLAAKVLGHHTGCRFKSENLCETNSGCVWHNTTSASKCNGGDGGTCSATEFDILHAYVQFPPLPGS